MLTRGDKNNRAYVGETVKFAGSVTNIMQSALFDPQTAGGLLISMSSETAAEFVRQMPDARVVGSVAGHSGVYIEVK